MRTFLVLILVSLICFASTTAGTPEAGVQKFQRNNDGVLETRLETLAGSRSGVTVPEIVPIPAFLDEVDDFTGQLVWQTGDGTGLCNDCAVSPDGNFLALGISLNNERCELYNVSSSLPLWQYDAVDTWNTKVAVSRNAEVFAFSADQYLRVFNAAGQLQWSYDYGAGANAGPVAVRSDGDVIVATWSVGGVNKAAGFSQFSSTPVWTFTAPEPSTLSGWYGVRVSEFRTTINTKFNVWVLDCLNGVQIWSAQTNNTESAVPISQGGHVIAIGSLNNGRVTVYGWDGANDNYIELWHYTFTGGTSNWCSSVAVSADGNTVAAGSLNFLSADYDGKLAVFETWGTGTPLWVSSSFGDMVGAIGISDDGLTIAAGSWGDMGNALPDLRVFEKYTQNPFYTYNHPGSINSVDLSADGTKIFAGGKHVHNRMFGNGGDAYYVTASLGGGRIMGQVNVTGGGSAAGVKVEVLNANRYAYTNANGQYGILHVPAGTHTVRASKPGVSTGTQSGVVVNEGGTTTVNFNLTTVTGQPTNLAATSGLLSSIQLSWSVTNLVDRLHDRRVAAGDEPAEAPFGQPLQQAVNGFAPFYELDETDDPDSIRVYRSMLSGGPYTKIATLPGSNLTYTDTYNLFPTLTYYYVVSALYPQGESPYSNQAVGQLDASYLNYNPTVTAQTVPVTFDGVLSPGEWSDAVRIDISDVFGYDLPNAPGSVFLYMKYNDQTDKLLVACEDHVNTALADNEGMGFYVDDDDNNAWTLQQIGYGVPGSEGNYWAYWHPGSPDLRYRSLSGGPYGSSYYYFPSPQLAFSQTAGYVTYEFAIPLSFRNVYDLALYGPDKSPGIGAFSISRDAFGNPLFNGWWPQNMASIVSNPEQFSNSFINATLAVPPAPVNDMLVERQGASALHVTWTDPDSGVDNLPLPTFAGLELWRNGQFLTNVALGTESYVDNAVQPNGWYEYSLRGWVTDAQGPLYGPYSLYVGAYVTADPQLTEILYDDGGWESNWIVSGSWDDNQFAVRMTPASYPCKVYTMKIMTNVADSLQLAIAADNGGTPGTVLAGPYTIFTAPNQQFYEFHVPGTGQPVINGGDFWVKALWLPTRPSTPGICMDQQNPTGRSWWFDNANGWNQFATQGNLMMRSRVGTATLPNVGVSIAPVNPPIVIPSQGGSFSYNVSVFNQSSTPQTFDAWIMVQLPNLSWYGPVLGPLNLTLPVGITFSRLRSQSVPGSAPPGLYTYRGYVGDYPSIVWDSSGFTFTKLTSGSGPWVGDWTNTGESFEPYLNDGEMQALALPQEFGLRQNSPNPFNPSTSISYQLSAFGHVSLKVYDTAGRLVATLVEGDKEPGYYQVTFDGSALSSGLYFVRMEAGDFSQVRKMMLIK
jgi:hypothetical protein